MEKQHRPRFHTMAGWRQYSQMSRTATYNAIGRRDLKAVKMGNRTQIDAEDEEGDARLHCSRQRRSGPRPSEAPRVSLHRTPLLVAVQIAS